MAKKKQERSGSAMNPRALSTEVVKLIREHEATIGLRPHPRAEAIINEDKKRLAKLPDPFCRWCKKRKPCDCR